MGNHAFRSPSLHALRAFEAAARHLSFTLAAEELHVTQAAISRHVRQLEVALQQPLFVRLHRRVELTPTGRRLADDLSDNFASIARSIDAARGAQQRMRVSVEPAFAARWLLPRMQRFLDAHADIDVELESTESLREVGRDTDMAIRYRDGNRRPVENEQLLIAVTAFPVLAPSLVRGTGAPKRPSDLLQYPLLHEDDGRYWQRWFEAAGESAVRVPRRMQLNDVALVLQAAVDGQGVALGDELLAGDDLNAGRLLKPFDIRLDCGAYWLVCTEPGSRRSPQKAFQDWLRQELAAQSGR